jgi:predicted RNA-binding protein YlxR (DUF448 family)
LIESHASDDAPQPSDRPDQDDGRERKCIVSGEVLPEARLIRFVAGPDATVFPDLARKLPGRGIWVEATRAAVDQAAIKNAFSRSAKTRLTVPPGLSDLIERLLAKRCLDGLGLARREGGLVPGFEKAQMTLRSGKAAWLVEASDGAADGRIKMIRAANASPRPTAVCGAFSAEELGLALGLDNVIHLAFLAGRRAERWTEEVSKLAGFRPLLPESWREETRNGRGV